MTETRRRDDLDGLRGLAIALVVIGHANLFPMPLGMAGVTAFFVLSGHIITTQLLREERIDLRNFYLRRALRLFPALLLVIGFVGVLGLAGVWSEQWLLGVFGALTYTTNVLRIVIGPLGSLEHAWSLAIEEQFYLVWPLVMLALRGRWLLGFAVAGAIVGTAYYLVTSGQGNLTPYYSTFTNGGALLAGCAVAVSRQRLPGLAGQLGVALIVVGGMMGSQLAAVIGAVLVVSTTTSALVPLAALGRRAYGIYLWNGVFWVLLPVLPAVVMTFVAAEVSWRFLEQPLSGRFHAGLRPGVRRRSASGLVAEPAG